MKALISVIWMRIGFICAGWFVDGHAYAGESDADQREGSQAAPMMEEFSRLPFASGAAGIESGDSTRPDGFDWDTASEGFWGRPPSAEAWMRASRPSPEGSGSGLPVASDFRLTEGFELRPLGIGAFQVHFHAIPVCDAYLRFGRLKDSRPYAFGRLPADPQALVEGKILHDGQIQSRPLTPAQLRQALRAWVAGERSSVLGASELSGPLSVVSSKACLGGAANPEIMVELWDMIFRAGGKAYKARLAGEKVVRLEPLFFQAEGVVRAYVSNPADGELDDFKVSLKAGAHLESKYFRTQPPESRERAEAEDLRFLYEEGEPEFVEANAFSHVTRMHDFYAKHGYRWQGDAPLTVKTEALVRGTSNNALYEPGEAFDDGLPRISLGAGDGTVLQNLSLDADVVAHEFGHHVVFAHLKSTRGQSLVLHEGLADFFAFSRTGDTCLGESICPDGSGACWAKNRCLRVAITDSGEMNYGDDVYQQIGQEHLQGQVISGLLWQLRADLGATPTTRVVLKAVEFLLPDSGFRDFFLSLMIADHELHDGANACTIRELAVERGYGEFISDVDCELVKLDVGAIPNITGAVQEPTLGEAKSKKKSKSPFHCGVAGGGSSGAPAVPAAVLFLPLLLVGLLFRR